MVDTGTQTFEKAEDFYRETRQNLDKFIEESAERHKRIEWEMEILQQQIGKLGNRFGEMVEHLFVPSIKEKFRALGFDFYHISENHKISANGRSLAEIDILLENGDIAVAVEVKAKPVQKDVDDHVSRMEILRQRADVKNDTRKYQGAIAGAIVSDEVRDYAHKTGFYVIEQAGDTVRINIPDGFKARAW